MGDQRRERIDELVGLYLDRLNAGEALDRFEILSDEPELGPEIIEKIEVFVELSEPDKSGREEALGTLGDYTLRRQIGRGGMGIVYEAWQGSLDRAVALKILPPGVAADDRAFHRFMREAKTAARLQHSHVVAVYGMGFESGTPYYAMEYVEGRTLAEIIPHLGDTERDAATPFGPRDDLRYHANLAAAFADVSDGLQHAHSRSVVHRDIKPSNLILDREGRLRILDFGLAHLEGQESLTIPGDLVGTPLYMSPEQARRRRIPVDHRTDIYSLGATFYEVVTGRPPFRGKDHHETLSQIIEREPRPAKASDPRIPADLETIILQCLRKSPDARYATAEALGQDLRRFVRGDPIEARRTTPAEKFVEAVVRQRHRFGLAAALLLTVLVGVGIVAWSVHEVRKARIASASVEYAEVVKRAVVRMHGACVQPGGGRGHQLAAGRPWALIPGPERVIPDQVDPDTGREVLLELERASRLLPGRPEAPFYRARALAALGRLGEATALLAEVVRDRADFVPARWFRHTLGAAEPPPGSPVAGPATGWQAL